MLGREFADHTIVSLHASATSRRALAAARLVVVTGWACAVPRLDVDFDHLVPSDTVTECPYRGRTSDYWSVRTGDTTHTDLAWSYDFPTPQLLPITGMVAFYNEKLDHVVDGQPPERPVTHFFR